MEDLGIAWTPLWRSLSRPISLSGQTITIPFDRPAGPDFASGVLALRNGDPAGGADLALIRKTVTDSSAIAIITPWPNNGCHVKRSGSDLTITLFRIVGMSVVLTIAETLTKGDALEVSAGIYGPGGPIPEHSPASDAAS